VLLDSATAGEFRPEDALTQLDVPPAEAVTDEVAGLSSLVLHSPYLRLERIIKHRLCLRSQILIAAALDRACGTSNIPERPGQFDVRRSIPFIPLRERRLGVSEFLVLADRCRDLIIPLLRQLGA